MKKIVIDDRIPFIKGVFEPYCDEVVYAPGKDIDAGMVADAEAMVVRTRTRCDASLLRGSSVRFIATATIGTDHIDEAFCRLHGIGTAGAAGCNAPGVAQYIASVLLNLERSTGIPLAGRTLGVAGVGHVGSLVSGVGRALGMKVQWNDPPRRIRGDAGEFVPLQQLLSAADFVTLHVPLVSGGDHPTFHLADETFFGRMKPTAWFINTSRGEVCSTRDLKSALRDSRIAGAVLDVWENEPCIDAELLGMVRFGTPHIAGYSADGKARGTTMAVRAVADFFGIGELAKFEVKLPEEAALLPFSGSFYELQRMVYDVAADSTALKARPGDFELLRNEYSFRRENSAFAVPALSEEEKKLLGFRRGI